MSLLNLLTDCYMTFDGDIMFDGGDLKTTSGIDRLKREVHRLLQTDIGDWGVYPNIGSSSERFIGRPNTRELGIEIESYLKYKLSTDLSDSIVNIRVIPTNIHELIILIDVVLSYSDMETIAFSFDNNLGFIYRDYNDVLKFIPSEQQTNDKLLSTHNSIWDNI